MKKNQKGLSLALLCLTVGIGSGCGGNGSSDALPTTIVAGFYRGSVNTFSVLPNSPLTSSVAFNLTSAGAISGYGYSSNGLFPVLTVSGTTATYKVGANSGTGTATLYPTANHLTVAIRTGITTIGTVEADYQPLPSISTVSTVPAGSYNGYFVALTSASAVKSYGTATADVDSSGNITITSGAGSSISAGSVTGTLQSGGSVTGVNATFGSTSYTQSSPRYGFANGQLVVNLDTSPISSTPLWFVLQ